MMVTMSSHGASLEASLAAPHHGTTGARNDFFWRSLPGRVSPSVIYTNNGWTSSGSGGSSSGAKLAKVKHRPPIYRDADADSNVSSSSSGDEQQPRKTSLVSRQLAKIRSSMRLRRSNTSAGSDSASSSTKHKILSSSSEGGEEDDRSPLMTTMTMMSTSCTSRHLHNNHNNHNNNSKRFRSQSTPTLCCCSTGPNRRCSQPLTIRTTPVRSHFQALARAFKRSVARKKCKSTSVALDADHSAAAASPSSSSASSSRKEISRHLQSLASDEECRPRLTTVLRDSKGYEAFRLFLKGEYSDENINFWSAVESYKKLHEDDSFASSSAEKSSERAELADTIFSTYLKTDATCEINISYETKAETMRAMKDLDASTFNRAQNEILFLMESDAFKRFITSVMGE